MRRRQFCHSMQKRLASHQTNGVASAQRGQMDICMSSTFPSGGRFSMYIVETTTWLVKKSPTSVHAPQIIASLTHGLESALGMLDSVSKQLSVSSMITQYYTFPPANRALKGGGDKTH